MTTMLEWQARKRGRWPVMTPTLFKLLTALAAADLPLALELLPQTARALSSRDWAHAVTLDGSAWVITGRGRRALAVYTPRRIRYDGMCPTCGVRPRRVYRSGQADAYCDDCLKRMRRTVRRKAQRKRAVKAQRARRNARRVALIEAGTPPTCYRPGCTEPMHRLKSGHVLDYCRAHYLEAQTTYNQTKRKR